MTWTLFQALLLVRRLQPEVMRRSYYLALAGGVLNKGHSKNDLDLVAVPRVNDSSPTELLKYLESELGQSVTDIVPNGHHYHFKDVSVDITVIKGTS